MGIDDSSTEDLAKVGVFRTEEAQSSREANLSKEELFVNYKLQVASALDKSNLVTHERYPHIVVQCDAILNKIVEVFSQPDQTEVVSALLDMIRLHAGQDPRLNGEIVVEHLLEVSNLLFDIVKDPKPEEVITALLHDAIEDRAREISQVSDFGSEIEEEPKSEVWDKILARAQISHIYGEKIREMLVDLIKPDYKRVITKSHGSSDVTTEKFQLTKNKLYIKYLKNALDNPEVAVIKLVDFFANAMDVNEIPDEHEKKRTAIKYKYYDGFPLILKKIKDPDFAARLKDPDKLYEQVATVFDRFYRDLPI